MKYEKSLLCREICNAINSDCSKHCNLKGACEQCENIADALFSAGARFPMCKTGTEVYELYTEPVPDKNLAFGWKDEFRFRPVTITKICIEGDKIRYYKEELRGKEEEVTIFTLTAEDADKACFAYNSRGEEA